MAKKVYIITETQADGEVLKFILGLENNPDIECRVFPTSYGSIPSTASTIDIIVRERYEDARIVVAFNSYFLKNKKILCEEKLETLRFIVGHSPYVALFCFHSTIEKSRFLIRSTSLTNIALGKISIRMVSLMILISMKSLNLRLVNK
jgi:hypothetical protein